VSATLDRYLLRELVRPFGFFVVVLTGVIWLTQSLRVIDTVVNSGQGAGVFVEFSALLLPFVMTIVLPLAAFGATLYAFNRLFAESEIVAMMAAGASGLGLARPVALFGAAVAVATAVTTIWLTPTAAQTMRDRIAALRADIANALIFEGQFLHPSRGLTIYVRENDGAGAMRGVFVSDRRDEAAEITYTAREALLTRTDEGPRLVMFDGAAQRMERANGAFSLLRFESLVFDLGQFMSDPTDRERRPQERFLVELIAPTAEQLGDFTLGRFYAEGHEQLSGPLYAVTLPLVAIAAVLGGGFSRRGYGRRIAIGAALGAGLRLVGVAARSATWADAAFWPTMYLSPLIGAGLALWWLAAAPRRRPAAAAPA
jgi:lipopolysaccharide export system permease protein